MQSKTWYANFTKYLAKLTGKSSTFTLSILLIVVWLISGPFFHYSDTWQLVINTTTTIITFMMVFVIQNTQNRDTEAMQVKLDELIRVTQGAHNALLDLEELEEDQIEQFRKHYEMLAEKARKALAKGGIDTNTLDE
ncbi:low affinity iron permease family protein [Sulfurospirillum halorespirans]|uniref:Putative iron permease n=1 Tax=Sulfurospirillum halorespirans DSM 13726 TaxID=1193502 RepID=A0A1D7TM92_9BACT|nr:low affinity iron permease family protein [Sulfurospirillum halorespirans]AOO66113.1 putative iron permease [Sulfurospirillum halorespirans DSM 13726]